MADPRYSTARWQKLRAEAIRKYGKRCAYPNCPNDMSKPRMVHADHIIEARDGGPFWDINNIQIVCEPHHRGKTLIVRAGRGVEPVSPNR